MPYVVFVKPPRIEELRLTRRRAKFICDQEDKIAAGTFSVRHSCSVSCRVFNAVDLGLFYKTWGVPGLLVGRLMFPIYPTGGTCCPKVDI